VQEELRICRKCHYEKSIAEFTVIDKRNGRRKLACRACESVRVSLAYAANPEAQQRARERTKAWRRANTKQTAPNRRKSILKSQYGLTSEQFAALVRAQSGKCALCGAAEHGRSTVAAGHWLVDHNHDTGEVRGLLCNSCNIGLGHYERLLREVGEVALLEYLTRPCPVPPPPPVETVSFVPRYVADIPGAVAPLCSVEGCERDAGWNGMCHTHHMNRFRAKVLETVGEGAPIHQRGATQWKARLTDDDVRAIRASTETGVDLAMKYDVSTGCISQIKRRQTWKHVE
jgi:hypothetical protein